MLEQLKFVKGAVATSSTLLPAFRHFCISGGHVMASNGIVTLSSPIASDLECAPQALPMISAIAGCKSQVSMRMADNGRLFIKSGKFTAFIPCLELDTLPHVKPSGDMIALPDGAGMLAMLARLVGFIGDDASRPWCNGILLKNQSAYTTNNICLLEGWLGVQWPIPVNIPAAAVAELLGIGRPPIGMQINESTLTFHFDDGAWLLTQLLDTAWPPLDNLLARPSNQGPVPLDLFDALASIKPFLGSMGVVYFRNGAIHTTSSDADGASYVVEGLHNTGTYHHKPLSLLKDIVTSIDFAAYPEPLVFYGKNIRGVLLGMRA